MAKETLTLKNNVLEQEQTMLEEANLAELDSIEKILDWVFRPLEQEQTMLEEANFAELDSIEKILDWVFRPVEYTKQAPSSQDSQQLYESLSNQTSELEEKTKKKIK